MANPAKKETDSITISAGGKSVTVTSEQLKNTADALAPKNTQTLVAGFISELVKNADEIERETDKHIKPLTAHRKDLLKAAKDNQLNVKAIKNAVKFKRAEAAARKAMSEEISETEVYLSYVQIDMFPAA